MVMLAGLSVLADVPEQEGHVLDLVSSFSPFLAAFFFGPIWYWGLCPATQYHVGPAGGPGIPGGATLYPSATAQGHPPRRSKYHDW